MAFMCLLNHSKECDGCGACDVPDRDEEEEYPFIEACDRMYDKEGNMI